MGLYMNQFMGSFQYLQLVFRATTAGRPWKFGVSISRNQVRSWRPLEAPGREERTVILQGHGVHGGLRPVNIQVEALSSPNILP